MFENSKQEKYPKEGTLTLAVNIRDPPETELDLKKSKNYIHNELIFFPMTENIKD